MTDPIESVGVRALQKPHRQQPSEPPSAGSSSSPPTAAVLTAGAAAPRLLSWDAAAQPVGRPPHARPEARRAVLATSTNPHRQGERHCQPHRGASIPGSRAGWLTLPARPAAALSRGRAAAAPVSPSPPERCPGARADSLDKSPESSHRQASASASQGQGDHHSWLKGRAGSPRSLGGGALLTSAPPPRRWERTDRDGAAAVGLVRAPLKEPPRRPSRGIGGVGPRPDLIRGRLPAATASVDLSGACRG